MIYIILVIFILLILFIFIYPFKVYLKNDENKLLINISNFITLKLDLLMLIDGNHNKELNKQINGFKLINKLKFDFISVRLVGINWDYNLSGFIYGILQIIFSNFKLILANKGIKFDYYLGYGGDKYIEINSEFRARIKNILSVFYGVNK